MTAILASGLATPLGLGRDDSVREWMAGSCGLTANSRWNPEGFPRPDAGLVPDFRPRRHLPDRKAVKIMSRESQLAVYAAVEAAAGVDVLDRLKVDSTRAGAFAAAGYEVSSLADSEGMLAASRDPSNPGRLDVDRLFTEGRGLYNPLSPLKILPNMPLFHAGLTLGLRGPHLSLGSSPAAGLAALGEATESLRAGACELALVLGSDAQVEEFRAQLLVEAGVVPTLAAGEAASALLLAPESGPHEGPRVVAWDMAQEPSGSGYGETLDGGETRRTLYARLLSQVGEVDLCLGDLWGDPVRDAAELAALSGHSTLTCTPGSTRAQLGWLGAAQGLVDVALACEAIRSGQAHRALITASGLAGDLAAVVLESRT